MTTIHQHHADNVVPYMLVIRKVLPYVLAVSALGAVLIYGGGASILHAPLA